MKKKYEYIISDVAMEISIDGLWRKRILNLKEKEVLKFGFMDDDLLPKYVKEYIVINKMVFGVQIVDNCEEKFDDDLVIFKFFSLDYPDIISYSGNNPNIF